ncbi:MAG TPA: ribosome maturation factor RimP [Acidothermaceae bacterium]
MTSASAGRELAALLSRVVEGTGLELEDVAVTRVGHRAEVRVLVDKDGGVSLDDVAVASQAISTVLELPAADAILGEQPYVLEVSSPGVDRPLVDPRQWRRAAGRLVRVRLAAGTEITARIVTADTDGVRLAVVGAKPGAPAREQAYGFDELGPGRVQVEFNRPSLIDDIDELEPEPDVSTPDGEGEDAR